MPLLFSYGTLQLEAVQLSTFGRRLEGAPRDADGIRGTVFRVTAEELRNADTYEVAAYKRVAVTLRSGARAWVYVDARYAPPSRVSAS